MTFRREIWFAGSGIAALSALSRFAAAGGLLLPGAGPASTSRAGAAVASADDGEALVLNPAGIAKAEGTTITVGSAFLDYVMEFQRRGSYDPVSGETYPYAGQPFAKVKNDSSPFGIGGLSPVPVIAVLSDLGGRLGGLHLGVGVYAPSAYPFRDLCTELPAGAGCQRYEFNFNPNIPPPPSRYDIMKEEATVLLPSIAAAYRILPELDVGVRLSWGYFNFKSTAALWGVPDNYQEDIKKDVTISADVTDAFVPGVGLGVTYRPTPNLEFGANYSSELDIYGTGTATSNQGPAAVLLGAPVTIAPRTGRCDPTAPPAPDGATELKACIGLAIPMTAQLAARYKFLDAAGKLKGDIELDLGWENWGKSCPSDDFNTGHCLTPGDHRVVIDAEARANGQVFIDDLKEEVNRHGFRDTYAARLGGSYHLSIGAPRDDGHRNELILRGGLGYETAAATTGWMRIDIDGAARTTIAIGAAYRMQRFEVSAGGGAILEGSPSNPNVGGGATPCNPTSTDMTCNGSTVHQGPDSLNPLDPSSNQRLNPVSQGDYKAHYLMFTLGVSAWF